MKTFLSLSIATALILGHSQKAQAQFYPTAVGPTTTNATPYAYVGKLNMTFVDAGGHQQNYVGSATTIKPYSALTAGHCVYDSRYGWLRSGSFERAKFYASVASRNTISRMWIIGGYSTHAGSGGSNTYTGFSFDAGAVICSTRPANGGYAGWWASTALLTNSTYKMSLGYGATDHDGQQMLRSAPTKAFSSGSGAFFINSTYRIEGGMSGGPLFSFTNNNWYVCAINVAGSSSLCGVRALDSATSSLINSNLY